MTIHSTVDHSARQWPPALTHQLPCSLASAAVARGHMNVALAGYPADTIDAAQLLVSELVANAVLHARTEATLRITVDPPTVRVSVQDSSLAHPSPHEAAEDATGGRGLQLVQALACSWGWDRAGTGKQVWFELRLEPELT